MNEPNESPTLDLATTTTKTRANLERKNDQIKTNQPTQKTKRILFLLKKDTHTEKQKQNNRTQLNWTWTRP
jgi:hypothetical protein